MSSRFFVVTGPSAVGKSTIVRQVAQRLHMSVGVSTTTREPREGEENHVHYHFVPPHVYRRMWDQNEFIESDHHFGNFYGFEWAEWHLAQQEEKDLIVILDPMGTEQARRKIPDLVDIFIKPGSYDNLRTRLEKRGCTEDEIHGRMVRALWEIEQAPLYRYRLVNLDGLLKVTVDALCAIVERERQRAGKGVTA